MPVYDNVRTLGKVQVGTKLYVSESIRHTTTTVSGSGAITATNLFETVILTSNLVATYTLPVAVSDDDGATCLFINAGTGSKTITVGAGSTIDGSMSSIALSNQHDHISLRYVHANTTWYRL